MHVQALVALKYPYIHLRHNAVLLTQGATTPIKRRSPHYGDTTITIRHVTLGRSTLKGYQPKAKTST